MCLLHFIRRLYYIASPVVVYMMVFDISCNEEAITSKLYWSSINPRPENRCVNYVYVKFSIMSIYFYGIILDIFYMALYLVVQ